MGIATLADDTLLPCCTSLYDIKQFACLLLKGLDIVTTGVCMLKFNLFAEF